MPQTVIENTVSARDLDEMQKFYGRQPWGSRRDNIHAGFIAAVMANAFRGKKSKAVSYKDFMLIDRDEHRKTQTQQFLGGLKALAKPKKKKKNG